MAKKANAKGGVEDAGDLIPAYSPFDDDDEGVGTIQREKKVSPLSRLPTSVFDKQSMQLITNYAQVRPHPSPQRAL